MPGYLALHAVSPAQKHASGSGKLCSRPLQKRQMIVMRHKTYFLTFRRNGRGMPSFRQPGAQFLLASARERKYAATQALRRNQREKIALILGRIFPCPQCTPVCRMFFQRRIMPCSHGIRAHAPLTDRTQRGIQQAPELHDPVALCTGVGRMRTDMLRDKGTDNLTPEGGSHIFHMKGKPQLSA